MGRTDCVLLGLLELRFMGRYLRWYLSVTSTNGGNDRRTYLDTMLLSHLDQFRSMFLHKFFSFLRAREVVRLPDGMIEPKTFLTFRTLARSAATALSGFSFMSASCIGAGNISLTAGSGVGRCLIVRACSSEGYQHT